MDFIELEAETAAGKLSVEGLLEIIVALQQRIAELEAQLKSKNPTERFDEPYFERAGANASVAKVTGSSKPSAPIRRRFCASNVFLEHFGDQRRIVLFLQMLDLIRGEAHLFQVRDQAFPSLFAFFSFRQIKLRHLLHRLLQRDIVEVPVVIFDYLFLIFCARLVH